jgi:hypothetical protein
MSKMGARDSNPRGCERQQFAPHQKILFRPQNNLNK